MTFKAERRLSGIQKWDAECGTIAISYGNQFSATVRCGRALLFIKLK